MLSSRSHGSARLLRQCLALVAFSSGTLTLAATPAAAQGIGVDPRVVFIHDQSRVGSLTLVNPSATPVEVTIGLQYAYASTDSLGNGTVIFPDSGARRAIDRSAAEFVTIFPRRAIVPPKGMQTVHFRAAPPADLPEGEFWSRFMVTARGGQIAVSAIDTTASRGSDVRVGLTLELRTAFPLFFRKGTPQVRLLASHLTVREIGDTLEAAADLVREGTAAWLGTATVRIVDPVSGRVLAAVARPHAVYFTTHPRYRVALPADARGRRLRVELALETARNDVPREELLRAPTVELHADITPGARPMTRTGESKP